MLQKFEGRHPQQNSFLHLTHTFPPPFWPSKNCMYLAGAGHSYY